jgi:hypothetical protein
MAMTRKTLPTEERSLLSMGFLMVFDYKGVVEESRSFLDLGQFLFSGEDDVIFCHIVFNFKHESAFFEFYFMIIVKSYGASLAG